MPKDVHSDEGAAVIQQFRADDRRSQPSPGAGFDGNPDRCIGPRTSLRSAASLCSSNRAQHGIGDHAGGDAVPGQQLAGFQLPGSTSVPDGQEGHFGIGVAMPARKRPSATTGFRRCACRARSAHPGAKSAIRRRDGDHLCSSASSQAFGRLHAVGGADDTFRLGMARSAARCSTGWCVGPSSPRPMLNRASSRRSTLNCSISADKADRAGRQ